VTSRYRAWFLGMALVATARTPALAQVGGGVDLGLGAATGLRNGMASLLTLLPSLSFQRKDLRLSIDGGARSGATAPSGVGSLSEVSQFVRRRGPFLFEATGALRTWNGDVGSSGALWSAGGRLHVGGGRGGGWLELAGGNGQIGPTTRWGGAVWSRIGSIAVQVQGSQQTGTNPLVPKGPFADTLAGPPDTLAQERRYQRTTDLGIWAHWTTQAIELSVAAGRRWGTTGAATTNLLTGVNAAQQVTVRNDWWAADATWWFSPRLGFNAAVGTSPPDFAFQIPATKFFRFSFRASFGRPSSHVELREAQVHGVQYHRLSGDVIDLQVCEPATDRPRVLEVRGDFTDWRPVELRYLSGCVWHNHFVIAAGMHSLEIRADGGPWHPPAGAPVQTDEFERQTGTVVVE